MRKSIVLVTLVLSRGLLEAQTGDQYWDKGFGIPGADLSGVAAILPTERGVLFAGNFSTIGGISASKVALWYRGNWFALGVGVTGFPTALATTHGQLYVGGLLYEAGGFPVSGIARWDGTNWAALGSGLLLGSGVNGIAFATASDGSNLFVGGRFDFAGGVAATNIAKWDGTNWSALGLGIPPVLEAGNLVGAVDSLTFEGGCLYVGGQFQQAGGLAATNIARWDGNYWQAIGHGLRISNSSRADNGSVHSLLSHRGVLYAGGVFKLAGEVVATNIARWSNGVWESVGHANNAVTALIPYGNGVVAGGSFLTIGGVNARILAYWNGIQWLPFGSGIFGGGIGNGLASTGTELFVGGQFTSAGGNPSTNIALYHIPHLLEISRQGSGVSVRWPSTGTNFLLEARQDVDGAMWSEVDVVPRIQNEECVVSELMSEPGRFYRLRRKPW